MCSRDGDGEETAARVQQLRQLGVEEQLRGLEHDACLSVKERASTALEQLQVLADMAAAGGGGGGGAGDAMEAV